jgi:hypothetical protein
MLAYVVVAVVAVFVAYPFLQKRGMVPELPFLGGRIGGGENAETVEAGALGHTEVLCPYCSQMNSGSAVKCVECGSQMPVDSIKNLWDGNAKQEVIKEGIQCGVVFVVMLTAMALSYNLPTTGKLVVLLATFAGLAWRFLKVIQD